MAYLPKRIVNVMAEKFAGKFSQIIEFYDLSENSMMRRKSNRNRGIPSFRLLNDIQEQE